MLKTYITQIALIVGVVGIIGALPEVADLLSREVPQAGYVQTFRPSTLSENVRFDPSESTRTARQAYRDEAQTASLSY